MYKTLSSEVITEDIPETPVPHLNSDIRWTESCRADFGNDSSGNCLS